MKNINIALGLLVSASIMTACSGVRTASSPTGPVTPASGSASNIASGRNITGTPLSDSIGAERQIAPGVNAVDSEVAPLPAKDKPELFIEQMTVRGLGEIEFSKLASKRADNGYVKALAAVILKDQEEANAALKAIVASKNIKMDTLGLDKQGLDRIKQLSSITGEEFEVLYLKILTQDHEQQIRLYEAATASSDEQLKSYAKKYLPVYKGHLKSISKLNTK